MTEQEPDELIEKVSQTEKLSEEVKELITNDQNETAFKTYFLELLLSKEPKNRAQATELLAKKVKEQLFIFSTRNDINAEMWVYSEGIYIPEARTFIKEKCRKLIGDAYTSQIVNAVIQKIEADTFIDPQTFFENNIPEEIVCLNGLLNLKTKELLPFDPRKIHFAKLPVTYNKQATCDDIDLFLDEILETADDKKTIYELFGYCLLKDLPIEQGFMLLGEGRNGKGKTIELLKRMLGQKNTVNIPIQSLTDQGFNSCELFGKLANLAGDISDKTIDQTGMFKSLTGRDLISANRKFKEKISFVNYSKQIFSTNKLPKTDDTTIAFWERWVFFRFPYTFLTQEDLDKFKKEGKDTSKLKLRDPNRLDKISTPEQLSGLLNKSLEGLDRLLKHKKFTTSKTSEEIKMLWIRKSDSFLAFCFDCVEEDSDGYITKEDLRKKYKQYCKENRVPSDADDIWIKKTLANEYGCSEARRNLFLLNEKGEIEKDSIGKEIKDRIYVWEGIKFKGGNSAKL